MTGRLFFIGHKSNRMTKEAAEELEEMGEDTSDMIMSQSKMREMIMNATKVASNNFKGVDIQTELGNYKSTFQILSEIGAIWDEIKQADLRTGDNRQNLLLEAMAGKNRANTLASVLMNNDILQSAYQDSKYNAAGKATEELEKVSQSITFHLNQLTNAWQELWANAANRDVINMFIDLGTAILNLINNVGGLQSAFTFLWGGSILKGLMTADSWLVKFVRGLDAAKASSQGLSDVFKNLIPVKLPEAKGLQQIQKDREQAKAQPTSAVDTVGDAASIATKQAKADASERAAQANLNEIASEQALQAANRENIATETEETAAKISGTAASDRATQENIKEAESAKLAAKAIQEKSNAEIQAAETSAAQTMASMSPKALAKFETKFDAAISKMQKASGQGVMDWSMAYVDDIDDIGEAAMNAGREIAQMGEIATNTATGFGAIGMSLAGLATNPMTWLIAIPAVIAAINGGLSLWRQHQQDIIDKAHETTTSWNETKTSIDDFATKYTELNTQLQNQNLSEQERADIKKQVYELQKQITDEYGKQAEGINLINGNLDTQLAKLRSIKQEEARENLRNDGKVYREAVKQMTETQRQFQLETIGTLSNEDFQKLTKDLAGHWSQFSNQYGDVGLTFTGTAEEADLAFNELYDRLGDMQQSMGKNWSGTIYESLTTAVENATAQNSKTLTKYKDDYISYLEQSVFADTGTYGEDNLSAGEILTDLEEAVNNYNMALASGDTAQIDKAKESFDKLSAAAEQFYTTAGNEKFTRPFTDLENKVDQVAEKTYEYKKKLEDPKTKSMAEAIFGKFADTKKISKDTQKEILDAANEVLNIQRELADKGFTDIINPLYDPVGKEYKTKFGNLDLNNRPVLTWDKANLKKYRSAWNSWNWDEMPVEGDISTVLGARGEFGKAGYEIAFTPLLEEDGKLELLDQNTVTNYLNDIVDKATKANGEVDTGKLLTLDADPKEGKRLIASYGKMAKSYDQIMHYVGKDGALTTAFTRLQTLAKDNGLSFEQMISSMAEMGNRSGIRDMFKDAVPSIEDVRAALADTSGEFEYLQNFAEQEFGITAETPDEQVYGFIEAVMAATDMVVSSSEITQSSLDETFKDVSQKIEKVSSLGSIIQKGLGQGGLTFTKLLDEQGNIIESDVSKIRDAYEKMYDFDLGSLFEETATGIKLNMDAYRQLAQEEEASTKIQLQNQRDLLEARQRTLERQGAPDSQIRQLQEQITELDMLAAAYDGATSATAKYLAQQNAADYGDTYEMFRDTTIKRADELMGKGMIGTEEFRTIAQLFSYDSLATASADKVLEAYQKGYANVSKYITEDATVGMQTFLDDLVALPEEYGKFTKDAAGNYLLEFTDAQEDKLAEHLGVSKDMLESFYDMLNALGFNIHFFRDGTLNEFDKLNENINTSKERLKELKENANDPNLIPDDVLDFNIEDLNTVEQLEAQLHELQALDIDPKVNPQEYEAWKQLLDQIQKKIDKVTEAEIDPKVGLKDYETADEALKLITDKTEQAQKLAEKGIGIDIQTTVENDAEVDTLANTIANWPKQLQTYMGFEYSSDPEEIKRQLVERISGEPVEIPVKPIISAEEFNEPGAVGKVKVDVGINPESIGAAKQEAETGLASNPPEVEGKVKMPDPDDYVWQGASIGEIHIPADVDDSEAKSTLDNIKEDAEQPVETPLHLIPDNTAQDAANQAGAQQGVQTTKTETKITNEEVHSTATADTSQLDSAQQSIDRFKEANGSVIGIGVNVETQEVDIAEEKIAELEKKNNKIVNITIGAKTALFGKAYTDTINKLNTLAKKETKPEIKADNSNLKDKVSESKNRLDSIKSKSININANAIGFSYISSWKSSTYDQLHNKSITITTHYTSTGTKPSGGFNGTAHYQGTAVFGGKAYARGVLSGNWGLPKAEKGALINELGSEIVVKKFFIATLHGDMYEKLI